MSEQTIFFILPSKYFLYKHISCRYINIRYVTLTDEVLYKMVAVSLYQWYSL